MDLPSSEDEVIYPPLGINGSPLKTLIRQCFIDGFLSRRSMCSQMRNLWGNLGARCYALICFDLICYAETAVDFSEILNGSGSALSAGESIK